MNFISALLKLGTEVFGSNEDLIPLDPEQESSDDGGGNDDDSSDGEDNEDDSSDGSGESSGSGESDDDGEDGSGEGDADGESDGSGKGSDGSEDGDEQGQGSPSNQTPTESNANGGGSTGQQAPVKFDPNGDIEVPVGLDKDGPPSAGGGVDLGDKQDASQSFGAIADMVRDGLGSGKPGIVDNNAALAAAVEGQREDDCESGEAVWRPYDPNLDVIIKPRGNVTQAEALRKQARTLTAALRTSFRRKFLQHRDPKVLHGVKRGKDLSERRLVESYVEIKSGVDPSRPDYRIEKQRDVSLAVAVVGDESGSMYGKELTAAATAMVAIAEAFDSLGSPVMCCGPRDGGRGVPNTQHDRRGDDQIRNQTGMPGGADTAQYHRDWPVAIDLFKDWDEPFRSVKRRFSAYSAIGSTPLSDGLQYALDSISDRPERHRVVLVLTDGEPNQRAVVKRQIRLAKEAGVTVIGVGISDGCYRVPSLFPDNHIVVKDLNELPKRMIAAAGAIVFPRKGGKRVALDGQIKRKVSKGRRRRT